MWPDPTDQSRLKPQTLKGTPANIYSHLIAAAGVIVIIGGFHLIWYIPYFQRKLVKIEAKAKQSDIDRQAKSFSADPYVQRALQKKYREYEEDPGWFK